MPVIKSAKKKLRQDKKREKHNKLTRNLLKSLIKRAKLEKSSAAIISVVKTADKAAKDHIIHKNKAARIKSSLSKLLSPSIESKQKKSKAKTKKAIPTTA